MAAYVLSGPTVASTLGSTIICPHPSSSVNLTQTMQENYKFAGIVPFCFDGTKVWYAGDVT